MNLKKSFMGAVAGLALIGSLAAPMASAQPAESNSGNNQTTATVTITDTGIFDVYFGNASVSLGTVPMNNTSTTTYAPGSLVIAYTDTKAYRPNFNIKMNATAFTNTTNSALTIPASNFRITATYNVGQTLYGNSPIDYGDIGYFVNNAYPSGQAAVSPWTANNTLDTNPTVHFGYAGVGTTSSGGQVDVSLQIPTGTQAGTYTSTMTLTVIAGTQP
jgi:hypothetical protein